MKVSVIIPMYQEAAGITACLQQVVQHKFFEVIVVDGGSTDGATDLVHAFGQGVKLLAAPEANRGIQMNMGAAAATGDVLLFLHVDMVLPESAHRVIAEQIKQGARSGGFYKRYDTEHRGLQFYQGLLNRLYLRNGRGLVGSNAMFVERQLFEELDGYAQQGFLEDVILADALAAVGSVTVIREPVTVSPRRYLQQGILRQIWINARIMFAYRVLKQSPSRLKTVYQSIKRTPVGIKDSTAYAKSTC